MSFRWYHTVIFQEIPVHKKSLVYIYFCDIICRSQVAPVNINESPKEANFQKSLGRPLDSATLYFFTITPLLKKTLVQIFQTLDLSEMTNYNSKVIFEQLHAISRLKNQSVRQSFPPISLCLFGRLALMK